MYDPDVDYVDLVCPNCGCEFEKCKPIRDDVDCPECEECVVSVDITDDAEYLTSREGDMAAADWFAYRTRSK